MIWWSYEIQRCQWPTMPKLTLLIEYTDQSSFRLSTPHIWYDDSIFPSFLHGVETLLSMEPASCIRPSARLKGRIISCTCTTSFTFFYMSLFQFALSLSPKVEFVCEPWNLHVSSMRRESLCRCEGVGARSHRVKERFCMALSIYQSR